MVAKASEAASAAVDAGGTRQLWTVDATPALHEPHPPSRPESQGSSGPKPLTRLFNRMRGRGRRADDREWDLPPASDPTRPELPPLRRGSVAGWWSARRTPLAVDEFLRERLGRYLGRLGVAPERLPITIDFDGGHLVVAPRPPDATPPEWLERYVREHGEPALRADIERARTEAARADGALDRAREQLEEVRRELETAARAPSLASSPDDDGGDPCGRPAVPPPWSAAIATVIAAMVLADAWQFALPLLRAAGIAPAELAAEASRRPGAVALPVLLALAASVALFTFAAVAARRARSLFELLPARWHPAVHVAVGGASLAMAAGLAWAILVPGASPGRARDLTPFLVAMALPLATPPLVALARRLHVTRSAASAAAAAWDQVHRAALSQWTRAHALATATERECAALEASRAAWTRRLHLLRSRAAEVERRAADAAQAERAELRAAADAILAALERDRGAYLRHARPPPPAATPVS